MYRYYYLGNIEKSKYYHSRLINGSYEPKDSLIRNIYQNIKKRKLNKLGISEESLHRHSPIIFETDKQVMTEAKFSFSKFTFGMWVFIVSFSLKNFTMTMASCT